MNERRKARQHAVQALYAYELSQNVVDEVLTDPIVGRLGSAPAQAFCRQLVRATVAHRRECDRLIAAAAANWELDRIALLDRLVLRQAICEFLYFDDVPPKVSMDEAIELAKVFGTDDSSKFINGLLDRILRDLQRAGRVVKSGRGLQDSGGAKRQAGTGSGG